MKERLRELDVNKIDLIWCLKTPNRPNNTKKGIDVRNEGRDEGLEVAELGHRSRKDVSEEEDDVFQKHWAKAKESQNRESMKVWVTCQKEDKSAV